MGILIIRITILNRAANSHAYIPRDLHNWHVLHALMPHVHSLTTKTHLWPILTRKDDTDGTWTDKSLLAVSPAPLHHSGGKLLGEERSRLLWNFPTIPNTRFLSQVSMSMQKLFSETLVRFRLWYLEVGWSTSDGYRHDYYNQNFWGG